jgi:hypothetical protein
MCEGIWKHDNENDFVLLPNANGQALLIIGDRAITDTE